MIGELVFGIFALMAQGQEVDSTKVAETGNAPIPLIEKQEKEQESQVAGPAIVCSVEINNVLREAVIASPHAAFKGTGTLSLKGGGLDLNDTRPIALVAGGAYGFQIPDIVPFPVNVRAEMLVKDQEGNIVCDETN